MAFRASPSRSNPNNDFEVASPPTDGVSSLSFSPRANLLVATSWDNQVRCWDVQQNGQAIPKASQTHQAPVLCSAWHGDGSKIFSAGCDNQAKMWDLQSNQQQQVAAHDAPIRRMAYSSELNMLVTGGWDRTLRYWDLRSPSAVHVHQLPERCYALSLNFPLLVVGTAERHIEIFNLQTAPQQVYKKVVSPLKYQTRTIAAFPNRTGYLVGSIEGRVAVHHVEDPSDPKANFTFKCHRGDGNHIYSVNDIAFHPRHGTFATVGSDGAYNFWDKDTKQRLKAMQPASQPIPCCCFNGDGSILAYALSYDWSRGHSEYNPSQAQNHIMLHAVQENEVKSKPRKK